MVTLLTLNHFLITNGYKIKQKSGWVVTEPLGGKHMVNSIEELEQYAKKRKNS